MAALSTMLLAATAVQAVGGILGGMQANKVAKENARIEMENAKAEAKQKAKEVERLRSLQQAQYGASGVTLDGTPLMVLDETQKEGDAEVNDILRRGSNNAKVLRMEGRNAFTSGLFKAAGTVGGNIYSGYDQGVFG